MKYRVYARHISLACALASLPAGAQPQAHPANPQAATATAQYQSAFEGYQPLRDEKMVSWREANDAVARAGGHIGILGGATAGHSHPSPAPAQAAGAQR